MLDALLANVRFVPGTFDDDRIYENLERTLAVFDERAGRPLDRVFYLSTAPQFSLIGSKLGDAGLNRSSDRDVRIVIEKPFGHDLKSARELNRALTQLLRDDQIYRIDHYLGKETVQNVLVFRFANGVFEPIWNRRYVDHVQITVAETVGVELRGGYYDHTGALRDMVPNHLLQLFDPDGNGTAQFVRSPCLPRRASKGSRSGASFALRAACGVNGPGHVDRWQRSETSR